MDVLFDGGNEAPQQSWATYVTATQQMGDAIGERAAADAYLQQVESALAAYGREVRAAAPQVRRYAVVQFADARQLRIFAPNSLFRVSLDLMGLEQADLGAGNRWGSRLVALPELAQLPEDTCLIIVGPFPRMTEVELSRSYLVLARVAVCARCRRCGFLAGRSRWRCLGAMCMRRWWGMGSRGHLDRSGRTGATTTAESPFPVGGGPHEQGIGVFHGNRLRRREVREV